MWQNLLRQKLSNKGSHKWQYSECLKVICWAAAALLWAARSQEPLYLLWSGCISSFQLQPQRPPWFAKQTTLAGRHPYSVSIFQDSFLGRSTWPHALECCSFPRSVGLLHMHLKNAQDFLIRATSRYKQLDVMWNPDEWLRPVNQRQLLLLLVSKYSKPLV